MKNGAGSFGSVRQKSGKMSDVNLPGPPDKPSRSELVVFLLASLTAFISAPIGPCILLDSMFHHGGPNDDVAGYAFFFFATPSLILSLICVGASASMRATRKSTVLAMAFWISAVASTLLAASFAMIFHIAGR